MDRNIEYVDVRGEDDQIRFGDEGTIYVQQPYDIVDWQLGPAKDGDVGMDLPVRIKGMGGEKFKPELHPQFPGLINHNEGWIDIPAGSYARIPSGIHLKMPNDSWMMVRPRSSSGFKLFIDTFEGTVDPGYTGHLMALVYNRYTIAKRVVCMLKYLICNLVGMVSNQSATKLARSIRWGTLRVKDGDRLIQVVLVPKYPLKRIINVDILPSTDRGSSGFGSSGGLSVQQDGD